MFWLFFKIFDRRNMSSVNKDTFISFFPICIPCISFCGFSVCVFYCTSNVMLKRGYLCLVLDFRGKAP